MTSHHQLAAVLFSDIVGYSALMEKDEAIAAESIRRYNKAVADWTEKYRGKVANYYGDGSLCVFPSVTDAIDCGVAIQQDLRSSPAIPLRMGLHIGEIFYQDGKVLGDGVNVASRIQSLGIGNSILVSGEVYDKIKNNSRLTAVSLGSFDFKNISKPLEVYALTNAGLSVPTRNRMEGKLKIQSPKPTRLLAGLAILVVLAGAGYLAYLGFKQPSSSTKTFTSIAVLPFADMSPEKNQEYLGDGLADDIISALSGIPELRVIGRTSSFQFKGSQVDLREVGDKLDVETVLEGSVQKSGNTLRITAQLINVEDGSHIWSRRWDREMTELFDVQDEIANGIREMLKVSLQNSGRESGQIVPEAYEAFLRGRQLWLRGNPNNLNHAMNHFRHAMNLEPGFADAAALLSLSYYQLGIRPLPVLDPLKRKQALDSSFWLARLAVSLDPNSATAHLAMAEMHQHYYEWEKAESELRRAHALNPGTLEKGSLGEFLGHLSSFESGSEFCLSGLSMDPLDINGMITYAHLLNDYGRYDEAIELTMRVLRMDSMSTRALAQLGHAYSGKKQYQEALLAWARQHESYGNHTLANKYRISEYREAMDAWIEEAENNQGPASPSNLTIAAIHAYLGDKEKVIHHLYLAYENRDGHIGSIKNRVIFGFIRDDPRWKELYKKLRFDKYDEFRASADKSP